MTRRGSACLERERRRQPPRWCIVRGQAAIEHARAETVPGAKPLVDRPSRLVTEGAPWMPEDIDLWNRIVRELCDRIGHRTPNGQPPLSRIASRDQIPEQRLQHTLAR